MDGKAADVRERAAGARSTVLGWNAVANGFVDGVCNRCIAVPGDASSQVSRLLSPVADFWPGSGRQPAREWPCHRSVWDELLMLRASRR